MKTYFDQLTSLLMNDVLYRNLWKVYYLCDIKNESCFKLNTPPNLYYNLYFISWASYITYLYIKYELIAVIVSK